MNAGVVQGEHECQDVLTVMEHSRLLLNKCGDVEEPLVIEASADEINITLSVKSKFQSKRGLMAYFTGNYYDYLQLIRLSPPPSLGFICLFSILI